MGTSHENKPATQVAGWLIFSVQAGIAEGKQECQEDKANQSRLCQQTDIQILGLDTVDSRG
jgi:hypothetical protein